jgi:hypothetical protein
VTAWSEGATGGTPASARPGTLPLGALVLARRVRALVAVTVAHTTVVAVAVWWAGGGPTLPGLATFAAHLAVSLGAALPVRWQFAGDPVSRQRRAVRAMTVSFLVLAGYSAVSAAGEALAPGRAGGAVVGAALGLAAALALPLLAAADARALRAEGLAGAPDAPRSVPAVLVAALVVVLLAAAVTDLLAGTGAAPSIAAPAVSAVVAVLAAREAWGAWRT